MWWQIRLCNLTSLKPPLSTSVEKLMNRISSNFAYTETYSSATNTENLKYFCGLALLGKFDKVVKVKDSKVAWCSILSEFGLETLSHLITNFSAVKARRETKFDYYVEETWIDTSTKWLVWEKSERRAIWNLLQPISNTNKFKFAPCLIIYAKDGCIRGATTNQHWVESMMSHLHHEEAEPWEITANQRRLQWMCPQLLILYS